MAAIDASEAPKGSEGVDIGGGMDIEGLETRGLCGIAGALLTDKVGWTGAVKEDVGLIRWPEPDIDIDGIAGGCIECDFVSPTSRLLFMGSVTSSGRLRFSVPFTSAEGGVGEY